MLSVLIVDIILMLPTSAWCILKPIRCAYKSSRYLWCLSRVPWKLWERWEDNRLVLYQLLFLRPRRKICLFPNLELLCQKRSRGVMLETWGTSHPDFFQTCSAFICWRIFLLREEKHFKFTVVQIDQSLELDNFGFQAVR